VQKHTKNAWQMVLNCLENISNHSGI